MEEIIRPSQITSHIFLIDAVLQSVRKIQMRQRWCERVLKSIRKADTRLRLQTKLCGETMICVPLGLSLSPSLDGHDRLFKVHNWPGQFIGRGPRKSDYKNRFILTGARDPTKTRPALNPLSARIETPHLLATTDAFTATDYRSFIKKKRERAFSRVHVWDLSRATTRAKSFYYFS